jgi:Protein tyrosine and serine/threonine kinase
LAALPTPDPRADARAGAPGEGLRLLRELGEQAVPAWAAIDLRGDGARLVVVDRAERDAFEDGEIADWIRDARKLAALDHPNVARVRDVVIRGQDVLVVSEFVDGVRWRELASTATLETALRVLADALTGLSAIHNVRDTSDPRRPLCKLVHGGLTPDCVVVGLDGLTRVVGASRPRSATARLAGKRSSYLAPEVLLEDESADARADVYSVGVLMWEALSQRRFLPDLQPSAIVTQLLSGRVPDVTIPAASPWAAPLRAVAMRALSADPEKRFPSAAAMAAELRRIGALKLPLAGRVGADVRAAFGDAIKARRHALEQAEARSSEVALRASRPASEELSVDLTDEVTESSPSAPTLPAEGAPGPPAVPDASPAAAAPPPPDPFPLPPSAPLPLQPAAPLPLPASARLPLPPAAPLPPSAPLPLATVRFEDATTTAAPFALATSATLEPAAPRPDRARRVLRIVVGGAAVLAIGAATWWIAARGPATRAPALDEAPASASPAQDPARGGSNVPRAIPGAASGGEPPRAASVEAQGTSAPTPGPIPSVIAPVAGAPSPSVRAPLPASVPARPKRAPTHRGYDPEGI